MGRQRSNLIVVVGCLCLAGCGGHTGATQPTGAGGSSTTAMSVPSTTTGTGTDRGAGSVTAPRPSRPPTRRRPPPPPDPCPPRSSGALPQTGRLPSASSPCFDAIVGALWRSVRDDSTSAALYAFFPLPAYEQVKAIGDPAGDYSGRLIAEYDLDLHAAHELLGSDPSGARLLRAIVPQAYVHWVSPGACYNRLGYYEVPNSRLVYRVGGEVRSFGIASLISWRGTWYVVHLGAVTRSGYGGVVDDPSDGTGMPAPSLTC